MHVQNDSSRDLSLNPFFCHIHYQWIFFLITLTVLLMWKLNFAVDIPYLEKMIVLDQSENIIALPSDFCVLEDECFVICDAKDQRVVVYDQNGDSLTQWKNSGQGPGEYQGIWFLSYQAPRLAVLDLRRPKVLLYERRGIRDFKWIKDIPESGHAITDFLLYNNNLYFDTAILVNNRFYFIHITDLDGGKNEYLLPSAVRYGGQPEDNYLYYYEARFRKIWGLPFAFLDVIDEYVYSAWAGDLRVFKINRKSQEWDTFGKKTRNYLPFRLEDSKAVSGQSPKEMFELKRKEREKYSWVEGLFADENLLGVLYVTFNKKDSRWDTFLQIYDKDGNFLRESRLPGVRPIDASLKYYYRRGLGCLYFLTMDEAEGGEIKFDIQKFRIR
jgi:hypothetical protein